MGGAQVCITCTLERRSLRLAATTSSCSLSGKPRCAPFSRLRRHRHLRRCHPRTSQRGMCSTLWLCCSCVPFAHVPWPSQDVDCCFRRAATGSWGGDGDWKVANSKVAFCHNFGSSCTRSPVHCCVGCHVAYGSCMWSVLFLMAPTVCIQP